MYLERQKLAEQEHRGICDFDHISVLLRMLHDLERSALQAHIKHNYSLYKAVWQYGYSKIVFHSGQTTPQWSTCIPELLVIHDLMVERIPHSEKHFDTVCPIIGCDLTDRFVVAPQDHPVPVSYKH